MSLILTETMYLLKKPKYKYRLLAIGLMLCVGILIILSTVLIIYSGKTYISNANTLYNAPDQVILTKQNLSISDNSSFVYNKIDDLLFQVQPNKNTSLNGFLSSAIDSLGNFIHYFDNGNSLISVSHDIRSAYTLEMNDYQISDCVKQVINWLPQIYGETAYQMFIDYWGTHVVLSGNSGGMAEQIVIIKNCFDGVDLNNQAELYMLF